MSHKDLRLGQIVYILVLFYNISFSWLLPLDGFQFIFLLRDSENDLYVQRIIREGYVNEVWLILSTTTWILVELFGSMFRLVVPTSENTVYKSTTDLLIKSIKPQILLFLKRRRPCVHNLC